MAKAGLSPVSGPLFLLIPQKESPTLPQSKVRAMSGWLCRPAWDEQPGGLVSKCPETLAATGTRASLFPGKQGAPGQESGKLGLLVP